MFFPLSREIVVNNIGNRNLIVNGSQSLNIIKKISVFIFNNLCGLNIS